MPRTKSQPTKEELRQRKQRQQTLKGRYLELVHAKKATYRRIFTEVDKVTEEPIVSERNQLYFEKEIHERAGRQLSRPLMESKKRRQTAREQMEKKLFTDRDWIGQFPDDPTRSGPTVVTAKQAETFITDKLNDDICADLEWIMEDINRGIGLQIAQEAFSDEYEGDTEGWQNSESDRWFGIDITKPKFFYFRQMLDRIKTGEMDISSIELEAPLFTQEFRYGLGRTDKKQKFTSRPYYEVDEIKKQQPISMQYGISKFVQENAYKQYLSPIYQDFQNILEEFDLSLKTIHRLSRCASLRLEDCTLAEREELFKYIQQYKGEVGFDAETFASQYDELSEGLAKLQQMGQLIEEIQHCIFMSSVHRLRSGFAVIQKRIDDEENFVDAEALQVAMGGNTEFTWRNITEAGNGVLDRYIENRSEKLHEEWEEEIEIFQSQDQDVDLQLQQNRREELEAEFENVEVDLLDVPAAGRTSSTKEMINPKTRTRIQVIEDADGNMSIRIPVPWYDRADIEFALDYFEMKGGKPSLLHIRTEDTSAGNEAAEICTGRNITVPGYEATSDGARKRIAKMQSADNKEMHEAETHLGGHTKFFRSPSKKEKTQKEDGDDKIKREEQEMIKEKGREEEVFSMHTLREQREDEEEESKSERESERESEKELEIHVSNTSNK